MKKYLYTLLSSTLLNLHAIEANPSKIKPAFAVGVEKETVELLQSKMINSNDYPSGVIPYIGTTLLTYTAGVAFRDKEGDMELDVRATVVPLLSGACRISASKLYTKPNRQRNKTDSPPYLGVGCGVGVFGSTINGGQIALFPRIVYGSASSYGFRDVGIDLVLTQSGIFPLPECRFGLKF